MIIWPSIIAGFLVLLGYLFVQFGLVPPPRAILLIKISEGKIKIRRGNLRPLTREFISEIFQMAEISRGFVAISSNNRVFFSWNIPKSIHQRLRNVLLNE